MSGKFLLSRPGLQTSACCLEKVCGGRYFSLTSHQQHKDSLSFAWKINKLNKEIKIIRNDVSGQFRPFFRGGKYYEPSTKKNLDPLAKFRYNQLHEISTVKPTDDVYVVSQFLTETYSLRKALEHLKHIAALDFVDPKAHIVMKINHSEVLAGKKRKKVFYYTFTKQLPHPTNYQNKVCVFTDDEKLRNLALENGAYTAGDREVIMKIMQNKLKCDYYISTKQFFDVISKNTELQKVVGQNFPNKKQATVLDDFVDQLKVFANEANFSNVGSDGTECKVVIGQLDNPVENLERNILFILENLLQARTLSKTKDLLKSVSISSFTEYIPFDFKAVLKSEDIE
uniref:39S ribosomal protein L1, mitochondrial n=1 Tax=Phallusia mammillata TaxID=59560 RepID=A0A6F9DLW0_9ASCI|nr:39S ribosomal protein L1, mitochondrial [Phallusia mammillata]